MYGDHNECVTFISILINVLHFVQQGSNYIIDNVQHDARGRYICEAYNEVGYDRRDILLTVQRTYHNVSMYSTAYIA